MLILNTNLKSGNATTQYSGITSNSICKAHGKYWSASSNGLYNITGNTDETSTLISANMVTATMDFGVGNDKRLRCLYLSLETTGNLNVDINTEKVAAISYPITISTSGQQDIRLTISRALYGRFWTFKVSNGTSGADFSIDEMRVLPIVRNRSH